MIREVWMCLFCRGDYGSPYRLSCRTCDSSGSCRQVEQLPEQAQLPFGRPAR